VVALVCVLEVDTTVLNLLLWQVRLKAREDLSRLPDGLDRFVIEHSDALSTEWVLSYPL